MKVNTRRPETGCLKPAFRMGGKPINLKQRQHRRLVHSSSNNIHPSPKGSLKRFLEGWTFGSILASILVMFGANQVFRFWNYGKTSTHTSSPKDPLPKSILTPEKKGEFSLENEMLQVKLQIMIGESRRKIELKDDRQSFLKIPENYAPFIDPDNGLPIFNPQTGKPIRSTSEYSQYLKVELKAKQK